MPRTRSGPAEPNLREVWLDAEGPIDCPIYRRETLTPGAVIDGPAVIEEPDSTTLVFRGDRLAVHPSGVLVLTIGGTSMTKTLELDSVGLHVLHNALANIAAEMALVMMKTSYSTIFNEGLDFSTVLLDREGNLIAEKNYTPSMMGAITHTVRWTLEEFGEDFFEPGDVVVHNDPLPRQLPHPRAHDDEADLPRRRAARLRRRDRPRRGGRRQGAGQLRLRRDRRLPGGPAAATREADRGRALQRAALAGDPREPPDAA